MRIKLDENLPVSLVDALRTLGHDVDTVPDEALTGANDKVVWETAQQAGRFLITQDLDFSDVRSFAPGTHHGLLPVRLGKPGRRALFERVATLFQSEDAASWQGCFVVASDRKLRVRRPAD
jgi:hypothetical protein